MAEINIIAVIGKLCPKVKRGRTVELNDLADEIALQSGFDRGDARDFAYKFALGLINHLKFGDYVKLGEIGSFYVTCDKNKNLRVVYRSSREMNNELSVDFRGDYTENENAGLDDEGYAQRWLELNPEDVVIMRDGSTRAASV
jgi:nucleoid DNA-binding protein